MSWKAYCFADDHERNAWRAHSDDLSLEHILGVLTADLTERGVLASVERPTEDRDLALLLIDTYEHYPEPRPVS